MEFVIDLLEDKLQELLNKIIGRKATIEEDKQIGELEEALETLCKKYR